MTNLTTIELNTLKAEELRTIAKEYQMTGAWKAKKDEMIAFLENIKTVQIEEARIEAERIAAEQAQAAEEVKPQARRKGRTRTIEVYKDGELINTIEGLLETFKWAEENGICNQGWVKESLRYGIETKAGRKFKEGGFLFKYSE